MLFNLDFAKNTFYHASFFFLIFDLYLLILAVITQIFSPVAGLVIPKGIPTKEVKVEIKTHPVNVDLTVS